MKFSQLIGYNQINNRRENEAGRLVPDLFFYKKAISEVKASDLQLSFNIF